MEKGLLKILTQSNLVHGWVEIRWESNVTADVQAIILLSRWEAAKLLKNVD